MKNVIFLFLLYFCFSSSIAQTNRYLGIGDTIQVNIENVQNYSTTSLHVPFKNKKLTVIHAISTTCAPCLEHISELDKYQHQYNKNIQIVLAFHDDLERINRFKSFVPQLANTKLPIVSKESGLFRKFQFKVYGSSVWIDKNGLIKNQTSSDLLNPENIMKFLEDDEYVKSIPVHAIDKTKSVKDNLKIDSLNSLTSSFQLFRIGPEFQTLERTSWIFEKNTEGHINRIYSYDSDLRVLAKRIRNQRYLHDSRIIFNIKAKEKLIPDYSNVNYNHFAFEILNNNSDIETLNLLEKLVGTTLGVQFVDTIMDIECYVLKQFKDVDFKSKIIINPQSISGEQGKFNNKMRSFSPDLLLTLNSYRWGDIVYDINWGAVKKKFDLFIIDETGIDPESKVDIAFYTTPENLEQINGSLIKYGLILEKAFRPLSVILVKDIVEEGV